MPGRMARAKRSTQASRSGGASQRWPASTRGTARAEGNHGSRLCSRAGPSVRRRPGAPPAMGPWRGEPTAHASPALGWVTSAERLCTARAPGAACFGSAQSKGYARATVPGVPSPCAAERRGVRPAAGRRKSHFERGASHFGRKRTARGRTRKSQGKPRRAPACGPARHWRFAGGAFTLPLTKGMLTPPWNPNIRFPALNLLYLSTSCLWWQAVAGILDASK